MTYELAQELNEAGFPRENILESIDGEYQFPTLSELIEACGHELKEIGRFNDRKDMWRALSFTGDGYAGETPEEAVAKLWLELNKKI